MVYDLGNSKCNEKLKHSTEQLESVKKAKSSTTITSLSVIQLFVAPLDIERGWEIMTKCTSKLRTFNMWRARQSIKCIKIIL